MALGGNVVPITYGGPLNVLTTLGLRTRGCCTNYLRRVGGWYKNSQTNSIPQIHKKSLLKLIIRSNGPVARSTITRSQRHTNSYPPAGKEGRDETGVKIVTPR